MRMLNSISSAIAVGGREVTSSFHFHTAAKATMAEHPPAYSTETAPSVPIKGDYQPQPQNYGATPPAPPYHGAPYSTTHNTVVVTQQPGVVTQISPGIKPNNYMVLSIINMLFCFFVLGLIALVFSLQVDSAWSAGNYAEAQRNANIARILNFIGIGVGIGTWIVVSIAVIANIAVAASAASYNPYSD